MLPLLKCRASGFVQSPTSIRKKIDPGAPISGKSNRRNSCHFYCHSIASGYFTDDDLKTVYASANVRKWETEARSSALALAGFLHATGNRKVLAGAILCASNSPELKNVFSYANSRFMPHVLCPKFYAHRLVSILGRQVAGFKHCPERPAAVLCWNTPTDEFGATHMLNDSGRRQSLDGAFFR